MWDEGEVSGTLGFDIGGRMLVGLRKEDLWPILEHLEGYEEDDLFDVIEFLFDNSQSR